ncbi:indole-3-glycerol phosphate synthase [Helicobacter sp. 11S03491-1]|uniref:indole-3-glycerol phosphate synthase n=1 Tax=Helicobacter sp. 11S03491-1 TaxID=1476196 RepID=UPI0015DB0558|nr:indole-3-glycerol phosphate synthase [Helicobacter sp. 11S03491-1]
MSFDLLGRSLSYNPYIPRAQAHDFARKKNELIAKKAIISPPLVEEELFLIDTLDAKAIMIDFTSIYEQNIPDKNIFDSLTLLRRYTKKLIIHNDIFISPYQLLESVIYGSDCVILEVNVLNKELKNMCAFALRLGLLPIVKIYSLQELKKAILAKAQMIYIAQDFSNLISYVPNSKIIFCDLSSNITSLDEKISYGVDIFFMSLSRIK